MTRLLGLLALSLSLLLVPARASAGDLTLRDVIELHRAGLGDTLLIAVIEADGGPFRLAYAEILDNFGIPDDALTDLLAAEDSHALPGLHIALQEGHTDAVLAFGNMVNRFPFSDEQVVRLFQCANGGGPRMVIPPLRLSRALN